MMNDIVAVEANSAFYNLHSAMVEEFL